MTLARCLEGLEKAKLSRNDQRKEKINPYDFIIRSALEQTVIGDDHTILAAVVKKPLR